MPNPTPAPRPKRGADLFEILGPLSDEKARRILTLLGLFPARAPAPDRNDEPGSGSRLNSQERLARADVRPRVAR